ncbi:MAG: hypothetical protein QM660_06025 [Dysgonomonas sp.]
MRYLILSLTLLAAFIRLDAQTTNYDPTNISLKQMNQKPEEEFHFKKYSVVAGFHISREMLESESPIGIYVHGGVECCWTTPENLYFAVEPRLRIGYLSHSTDKYDDNHIVLNPDDPYRISYSTLAWGASGVGRVGYILTDGGVLLYLETELGLINFNSEAKIKEGNLGTLRPSQNSSANFYLAGRIGLSGSLSSSTRMAVWAGIANIKAEDFIDKMNIKNATITSGKYNGELGITFFF